MWFAQLIINIYLRTCIYHKTIQIFHDQSCGQLISAMKSSLKNSPFEKRRQEFQMNLLSSLGNFPKEASFNKLHKRVAWSSTAIICPKCVATNKRRKVINIWSFHAFFLIFQFSFSVSEEKLMKMVWKQMANITWWRQRRCSDDNKC